MRSNLFRLSLATGVAIALAGAAHAQVPAPAPPPAATAPQAIVMLKPDLYLVTGAGGNVTVRVTRGGLIVVDTKNPGQPIYDALMAQIRTVSAQPVRYVIDTHHHADHTGNNGRFLADGAKVVAQGNLAGELAKFTPPANNPTMTAPAAPNVTYSSRFSVSLAGQRVNLYHFAPAHTGADTIVYFPDLKVVAMGDELNAVSPNFDYAGGASVAGWITSLDETLKLDWDQAIPGHGGAPFSRDQVKVFRDKLQTLLTRAREQVKAGTPKDKFVAGLKTDDLWPFVPAFWNAMRVDGLWAEAGGK